MSRQRNSAIRHAFHSKILSERLLVLAVVLTLSLSACRAVIPSQPGLDISHCTAIDPAATEHSESPCFHAWYDGSGEVVLAWLTSNPEARVYIYDAASYGLGDVGFQDSMCNGGECRISVNVPNGGYYRWILEASLDSGHRVYASAGINVPPLLPPASVSGGGPVDILSPGDQVVTWVGNPDNEPLDANPASLWIQLNHPTSFMFPSSQPKFPRSGPNARFIIKGEDFKRSHPRVFSVQECKNASSGNRLFCSGGWPVGFIPDSDSFLTSNPLYARSGEDLEILFTRQSGNLRLLTSDTLLPQHKVLTSSDRILVSGKYLTPGEHRLSLSSCLSESETCTEKKVLRILVDAPVNWQLGRTYTADFFPGEAEALFSNADPLDITFDDRNGAWMIGEFSRSVEHLPASGDMESLLIPVTREVSAVGSAIANTVRKEVKPFAASFFGQPIAASYSMLGERAFWDGSLAWFTQGGGMLGDSGLGMANHSRIISVDPDGLNLPHTPYDDRLCVYNMPTDNPGKLENNQVIGLVAAFGRIWVAESRGLFGKEASAISSFIPHNKDCSELLDFSGSQALPGKNLQYCRIGETPEADDCVARFLLSNFPPGLKVAHLAKDPSEQALWFTDLRGGYLGRYKFGETNPVTLYPLPDGYRKPDPRLDFGGFPWSLRVTDDAVFFNEYHDRDLVRFDKESETFHELHVPIASDQVTLHSIDIDEQAERLWFTLSMEVPIPLPQSISSIGYVDLKSWRRLIADPDNSLAIEAVIYKGLNDIPASVYKPGQAQNFRGIAVEASSGRLAISTSRRGQITILKPRSHFRAGAQQKDTD